MNSIENKCECRYGKPCICGDYCDCEFCTCEPDCNKILKNCRCTNIKEKIIKKEEETKK